MSFLQRLRDLDAKATPGPLSEPHLTDHRAGSCRCGYLFAWEGGEYCVATVHKESDAKDAGMGEYPPEDQAAANGGLLVFLRNSAARLAAVVEAGKAIAAAYAPLPGNPALSVIDTAKLEAMRAALTALDTEPT